MGMILKNNHNEMKISNLIVFIDNNTYLIKCSMHGSCLVKGKRKCDSTSFGFCCFFF